LAIRDADGLTRKFTAGCSQGVRSELSRWPEYPKLPRFGGHGLLAALKHSARGLDVRSMRVALAVDGSRGDVYPMLALADHLRSGGHTVVICGPPDSESDCRERGFELRPMGVEVRDFLHREAEGIASGNLAFAMAGKRYFEATLARQFERLPKATEDVDIIFGAGLCFAGASAAELHGIPYRFVTYCPVLLPSAEHAPFVLPSASTPRWLNRLLWRCLMPPLTGLLGIGFNRQRSRLGLGKCGDVYKMLLSDRPILSANHILAPVPADTDVAVETLPYLHSQPGPPLPAKLEAFLAAGPPPVYFGFGSMPDPRPDETTRLILEAVDRAGCRAVLSTGWAGLGEGALPENVHRTGAVDHSRLFPRMAAVVHHGGAGTTTTTARAGVPQLIVPHGVDQYYWAARTQALGVGTPPLPRSRLQAERLAGTLSATLDNELQVDRARELGKRMRDEEQPLPSPEQLLRG
jgi:vancomycin aglycone glucosyltransferase